MSGPEIQTAHSPDIKKMPVILIFVFSLLTAGIYYPCWFLSRRDQINKLHSNEKLGKGVFIFAIVIFSICLFMDLVFGFLEGGEDVDAVYGLLSLVVGIALLVQCFKVRRIFRNHFNEHLGRNISFSGWATFLFQFSYLQSLLSGLDG